jgi:hypothetical protein
VGWLHGGKGGFGPVDADHVGRGLTVLRMQIWLEGHEGEKSMRKLVALLIVSSTFGLAGCVTPRSDLERAVVGAAIGCAAGEVLVNGHCVEGAIVGAGVGVLTN